MGKELEINGTDFVPYLEKDVHRVSPYVVACIPAYNEDASIARVILSVKKCVDEVIVCDDGSTDFTGEIALGLGATLIKHEKNQGYGASIMSLFDRALRIDADYILTFDGDGQHQSADILTLLDRIKQGDADIVIGSRFVNGGKYEAPFWRKAGIKVITWLASKGGANITDAQSGFRVYTREAILKLNLTEKGMGLSTEILVKSVNNKLRIIEVPVSILYGKKNSHQSPITQGFNVLFGTFKYISMRKPLIFYGLPGLISSIISVIFWIWTLNLYMETHSLVTNITLLAIFTSIIGLLLMTTGIILWVIISIVKE